MIRLLTSDDNEQVMAFLKQESALNLFIIGDLENFGYDNEFQDVWAEFDDDGAIRAVLLRYYHFYIPYAPGAFDVDGFAAIINGDEQLEMMSGKRDVTEQLVGKVRVGTCKELYFAELTDDTDLGDTDNNSAVGRVTLDDLDDIFALRRLIEEFHLTESGRESFRKGVENGSSRTYGYRLDGQMVACASTTAENSLSAMVVGVCTHPEHRRKGYATLCMNALCRDILDEGRSLCLFYDNPQAGRIYQRIGFRDIGRWNMYYATPQH